MPRPPSGGIILSSVATTYQLFFVFHAAFVRLEPNAATPTGTCESAINLPLATGRSAQKLAWNFDLSIQMNPSAGGRIREFGSGAALDTLFKTASPASTTKVAT